VVDTGRYGGGGGDRYGGVVDTGRYGGGGGGGGGGGDRYGGGGEAEATRVGYKRGRGS